MLYRMIYVDDVGCYYLHDISNYCRNICMLLNIKIFMECMLSFFFNKME